MAHLTQNTVGVQPYPIKRRQTQSAAQGTPSDGYASPPPKPFWRTKWGIFLFSVLAIIIVIGAVVGGVVGARAGKGKGKGDEVVPLGPTSTTMSSFSRPVSSIDSGQPAGHSVEATTSSPETSVPVGVTPTHTAQPIGLTPVGPVPFTSITPGPGGIQTQPQFQTLAPPR
ncbi:hypothetical protein BD779DRAFT_457359 [Infundibulicybe gibba]|nr:hypothetical protein BD779DRAFT_457359 [Infundibulicybe gibba]